MSFGNDKNLFEIKQKKGKDRHDKISLHNNNQNQNQKKNTERKKRTHTIIMELSSILIIALANAVWDVDDSEINRLLLT